MSRLIEITLARIYLKKNFLSTSKKQFIYENVSYKITKFICASFEIAKFFNLNFLQVILTVHCVQHLTYLLVCSSKNYHSCILLCRSLNPFAGALRTWMKRFSGLWSRRCTFFRFQKSGGINRIECGYRLLSEKRHCWIL